MPATETATLPASTNTATDAAFGAHLLALARSAIADHLGCGEKAKADAGSDPRLGERGACFVTLRRKGELRGCIGSVRRTRSLGEDLLANAVAAASRDSRFAPLRADELADLRIEVSLLSEPEFLDFASEAELLQQLRPHQDGLILFAACRSATFLPQVWEQLPEPAQFLAALKDKAGIRPGSNSAKLMAARYGVEKWVEDERMQDEQPDANPANAR